MSWYSLEMDHWGASTKYPLHIFMEKYHIRPNYRTVCLGFSKLLGKYVSTYTKGTLKKDQRKICLMILMQFFSDFLYKSVCCGYSFELHQQVDAIQMSTHIICLFKEVERKYTCCNLKTTSLLDCKLIEVCAVIRSNAVRKIFIWIFLLSRVMSSFLKFVK